jgi:hypothetical protein
MNEGECIICGVEIRLRIFGPTAHLCWCCATAVHVNGALNKGDGDGEGR